MQLNVIIIECSTNCMKHLEDILNAEKDIKEIKTFPNVNEAIQYVEKNGRVDLIFSAIKMPEITGIDAAKLLRTFCDKFILTTCHQEFTAQAYESGVSNYLLKPIDKNAVQEIINDLKKIRSYAIKTHSSRYMTVHDRSKGISYKIPKADIYSITSYGNYVKVNTEKHTRINYMSLKRTEELYCKSGHLIRIHQSYIISINKILSFSKDKIKLINGEEFPISRYYKKKHKELFSRIK